jgi:hypothetical protein
MMFQLTPTLRRVENGKHFRWWYYLGVLPYILEHCDTFHTFLLSKFVSHCVATTKYRICLTQFWTRLLSVWVVAAFNLLVFGMAQQILTLPEKNGGLSKYGNVISYSGCRLVQLHSSLWKSVIEWWSTKMK